MDYTEAQRQQMEAFLEKAEPHWCCLKNAVSFGGYPEIDEPFYEIVRLMQELMEIAACPGEEIEKGDLQE